MSIQAPQVGKRSGIQGKADTRPLRDNVPRRRIVQQTEPIFSFKNAPLPAPQPYRSHAPSYSQFVRLVGMTRISHVLRVPLSTRPPLGGSSGTFVLPCRKVVLEYCEKSVASKGMRDFILQQANSLARAHPSVEFVVRPCPQRSPLLRGFYRMYNLTYKQ